MESIFKVHFMLVKICNAIIEVLYKDETVLFLRVSYNKCSVFNFILFYCIDGVIFFIKSRHAGNFLNVNYEHKYRHEYCKTPAGFL